MRGHLCLVLTLTLDIDIRLFVLHKSVLIGVC